MLSNIAVNLFIASDIVAAFNNSFCAVNCMYFSISASKDSWYSILCSGVNSSEITDGPDIGFCQMPGFVTIFWVTLKFTVACIAGVIGSGDVAITAPAQYALTPAPISPTKSYGVGELTPFCKAEINNCFIISTFPLTNGILCCLSKPLFTAASYSLAYDSATTFISEIPSGLFATLNIFCLNVSQDII